MSFLLVDFIKVININSKHWEEQIMKTFNILSIDAWREDSSWTWNNWFLVGTITADEFQELNTNRKLIKYMRDNGYLSDYSKGKISIDDDQYNIVFCDRKNGRPLYAIEYGRDM